MDVDDLTPLMKQIVDLIRPKAEDTPDAVSGGEGRMQSNPQQLHGSRPRSSQPLILPHFASFRVGCCWQLMNALDLLAKCHQASGDYKSAAYTLSSFKFDDFKYEHTRNAAHRVQIGRFE